MHVGLWTNEDEANYFSLGAKAALACSALAYHTKAQPPRDESWMTIHDSQITNVIHVVKNITVSARP